MYGKKKKTGAQPNLQSPKTPPNMMVANSKGGMKTKKKKSKK